MQQLFLKPEVLRGAVHRPHRAELLLNVPGVLFLLHVQLEGALDPGRGAAHLREGEILSLETIVVVQNARDEGIADDVGGRSALSREAARTIVSTQALADAAVVDDGATSSASASRTTSSPLSSSCAPL